MPKIRNDPVNDSSDKDNHVTGYLYLAVNSWSGFGEIFTAMVWKYESDSNRKNYLAQKILFVKISGGFFFNFGRYFHNATCKILN